MIGVFDSGVGGLSILKEFLKELPEYDYMYVGDNKRAPFGDLNFEDIYINTCESLDFLFHKGCKIVIIACNSISAKALRRVQQEYLPKKYPNKRVLGIIIPTVESLKRLKKNEKIGMIATSATIKSKVYDMELLKAGIDNDLFCQATPELVPLIETMNTDKSKIERYLITVFEEFKKKNINVLILGCTHYILIKDIIKKCLNNSIEIINIPSEVTKKLKDYLQRHSAFEKKLKKNSKLYLYTSLENLDRAQVIFEKYLNIEKLPKIKKM